MGTPARGNLVSISAILRGDSSMPKPRYQEPKIEQNGNGSYFIRPYVDVIAADGNLERKKKTIVLGPGSMGKRAAIANRTEVMSKINRSDYMIQAQIPLSDFLVHYRQTHLRELAASTRGKYESHLKNHIEPAFSGLRLFEISTRLVQDWLDAKGRAGLSWATRTDLRNILSSIFTKAADWGHWKERNPIERVSVGRKKTVREKRKLTDEQTRRLLAALPFDVRLMCCTALFCTLRISEILGLQEKHLDFANGLIRVRQRFYRGDLDVQKSEKSLRDVPMGYLSDDLKSVCKDDPERFVFEVKTHSKWKCSGVSRDDRDILQHFIRPVAVEFGWYFAGFGWHSLRREAVTAIGSVLSIGQTMNLAGHSSADMSLNYTLKDQQAQDEAVRGFQERIIGKPEGPVQ